METPTFIESYDTGEYELCDALMDRVDYYINEWMEGREEAI